MRVKRQEACCNVLSFGTVCLVFIALVLCDFASYSFGLSVNVYVSVVRPC